MGKNTNRKGLYTIADRKFNSITKLMNSKRIALKDISEYVKEKRKTETMGVVGSSHLDTKEQRRLNRELGLWGINKIGNTNGKR